VSQFPLTLGPLFMLLPPIPAGELDKPIRYMIRFRSPTTGLVLDEAYTTFRRPLTDACERAGVRGGHRLRLAAIELLRSCRTWNVRVDDYVSMSIG